MTRKAPAELRLVAFLNQPVYSDGSGYTTNFRQLTDLVAGLTTHFREVTICAPLRVSDQERGRVDLQLPARARIAGLPFYASEAELLRRLPRVLLGSLAVARREVAGAHIVGYVLPSMVGMLFAWAARGRPQFEIVRGDKVRTVAEIYSSGPQGFLYRGGARLLASAATVFRRRARPVTFTHGYRLRDQLEASNPGRVVALFAGLPEWMSNLPPPVRRGARGRNDALKALFVGRLSREKAPGVLLEALAIVRRSGARGVTLRIVGSGPEEGALRARIASLGLSSCVELAGWVDPGPDLAAEYDSADLFVLSSRTEGVPRSIMEAMARGLPVVATDVGSVSELVDDGNTGLLVPPGRPDALAAAMGRLRDEPGLAESLSAGALELVPSLTMEAQRDKMFAAIRRRYPELFPAAAGDPYVNKDSRHP